IWRRSKAIQELRALLREFYPGFLAAFAHGSVTNLASDAPPKFRIGDPIRSLPEWRGMSAGETAEIQS
ncbi:MAG: hypothetical protein LC721_11065, partial [Actinobacteria bacterium]|nr:hypothetical protein [Actinomycetota bacterium]